MNSTEANPRRCQVIDGEKLPADAGTADEICAAIVAATDSQAPGAAYSVEVRVLSLSSLSATARLGKGQTLPEQKMAVSDRSLNRSSIQRFAEAIGAQIARASER